MPHMQPHHHRGLQRSVQVQRKDLENVDIEVNITFKAIMYSTWTKQCITSQIEFA